MPASKLVRPSTLYKDSFLEALAEYNAEGNLKEINYNEISKNFEGFVRTLIDENSAHFQPLQDWAAPVRETVLWMVKDMEFIGYIKIRHRVNWHLERYGGHFTFSVRPSRRNLGFGKKIFQKAIPFANMIGIEKALITVSPDDHATQRIIEFCGAVFQDETQKSERFPVQKRYWIECQ